VSTATKTAAAALDLAAARKLTARIRDGLVHADGLLLQAWVGRAWLALGHATWKDYVAAELPDLQLLKVQPDVRDERIRSMAAEGMSMGAIADALAVGKGSVHRALQGVELPATTTSTDGRTMATRTGRAPARRRGPRKTERAVELAQSVDTFDVRDVVATTRWPQHKASATLTRLVQQGRLEYLAPERRGQFGRYRVVAR
jgi:hypothetical protein